MASTAHSQGKASPPTLISQGEEKGLHCFGFEGGQKLKPRSTEHTLKKSKQPDSVCVCFFSFFIRMSSKNLKQKGIAEKNTNLKDATSF